MTGFSQPPDAGNEAGDSAEQVSRPKSPDLAEPSDKASEPYGSHADEPFGGDDDIASGHADIHSSTKPGWSGGL